MRAGMKALALLACAAGLAAAIPTVRADGCATEDERQAVAQLNKAEALEKAGKLSEAYNTAVSVDTMCADQKRVDALRQRVGRTLGGQEEKKGQLAAAFDWYERGGHAAEADRVKLLHVKSRPEDINVFGNAYDHFKRREAESTLKELLTMAARNADKLLADEERAFAARLVSFDELDRAGDWLRYLGDDQMTRKSARAEKRGDALIVKDGLGMLENAIRYFNLADKPQKVQQVRDKAMRLGDAYVKTGETTTAANFYILAGADDKAADLEKRTKEANQKKESRRQEQFRQEQDDLEKELGF
jgi:hypothetical protein